MVDLWVCVGHVIRGRGDHDDERLVFKYINLAAAIAGTVPNLIIFVAYSISFIPEEVAVKLVWPAGQWQLFA